MTGAVVPYALQLAAYDWQPCAFDLCVFGRCGDAQRTRTALGSGGQVERTREPAEVAAPAQCLDLAGRDLMQYADYCWYCPTPGRRLLIDRVGRRSSPTRSATNRAACLCWIA